MLRLLEINKSRPYTSIEDHCMGILYIWGVNFNCLYCPDSASDQPQKIQVLRWNVGPLNTRLAFSRLFGTPDIRYRTVVFVP